MMTEIPAETTPLEPERYTSPWRGRDVLRVSAGIIAIIAAFLIAVALWINGAPGREIQPSIWLTAVQGALEAVALVGSVYLLGMLPRRLGWRDLGLRPASREWTLISVLIGVAIIPVSMILVYLLYLVSGLPLENPQLEFIAPEGFSWTGMAVALLFGGLLAPLAEEIYFRGLLYDWMRSRWGPKVGNILSSILFGIAHLDIIVGVQAFFLGLLLAWTYERSRSIWPATIIHILNNALKIVLLYAVLALQ